MTSDRQRQITALYHAALGRDGPARAAFLREACAGDDALRAEVESLLGYEEPAAAFLERPAIEEVAPLVTSHHESIGNLAGRRLGVYQIEAQIGAGGMGEVYRARDTKLGRDVAIKVLPPHLMADADRRARFEREARLLATLNHSNIAQIYGLEESDGLQGLVMELVPGETLDRMIRSHPRGLKVQAALVLARQIADAVDAAHERGIVHRDLKPANIVVTPAGAVKVLDFGLAKAVTGDASSPDQSHSPTITAHGTSPGLIIGTPAYMSPEQARGRPLDKRTDIWAFGCVLYEMLTGRLAFSGETVSDTIAAILEREPDWNAVPEATPVNIRRLLRRCVEKDPTRRLRDIGDARTEIDDAKPATPAGWTSARVAWLVTALIAVAVLLAVVGRQWLPQRGGHRQTGIWRLTFDPGLQTDPALSPDGQFIAYSSSKNGNFDIFVQQISGGDPIPVTKDPAHDWQPDWSPKGDRLVFRSERDGGGLMVVPAFGGRQEFVSRVGYRPRWSPDGTRILFIARHPISRATGVTPHILQLDGTPSRALGVTELKPLDRTGAWGWNPTNARVTFLARSPSPEHTPRLSTVDPDRGTTIVSAVDDGVWQTFKEHRLTVEAGPLAWAPDGTAIYFAGESNGMRNLWRLDIDPRTYAVTGGPRRLNTNTEAISDPTVSRNGQRVAFAAASGHPRIWSYELDEAGTKVIGVPEALTPVEMSAPALNLSADGTRLLFSLSRPGSSQPKEFRARQLSTDGEETLKLDAFGIWSPKGEVIAYRRILLGSAPEGHLDVWRGVQSMRILDPRTGGDSPLTSPFPFVDFPTGWSADGRSVISAGMRYKDKTGRPATELGFSTIALVPLSAAPAAETAVQIITSSTEHHLYQGGMSRDSRWVCFIAVSSADAGSRIVVVSSQGGDWRHIPWRGSFDDKPRWSYDGRLLYFVSDRGGTNNVWAVRFDRGLGKPHGEPFPVTRFDGPGEMIESVTGAEFGVGRRRLFLPLVTPTGGIWILEGIDR